MLSTVFASNVRGDHNQATVWHSGMSMRQRLLCERLDGQRFRGKVMFYKALAEFSYKPGYQLSLDYLGQFPVLQLQTCHIPFVEGTGHGGTITVRKVLPSRVLTFGYQETLHVLLGLVVWFERHEMKEWLKADGGHLFRCFHEDHTIDKVDERLAEANLATLKAAAAWFRYS